eukprot:8488147-Heterocapsa_arctica.AAC.1
MDPSRTGTMLTIRFITARRPTTHVYIPHADQARYQSHGSFANGDHAYDTLHHGQEPHNTRVHSTC